MLDVPAFGKRVGDLAVRPIVACAPDDPIGHAARRMVEADTGSVVVVDDTQRPVGIITDSDLRRVVARSDTAAGPLREIMSAPVVTIAANELGLEAVQVMLERHIHHLVVVDEEGRARGVVADSDIVAFEADRPLFLARRIERAPSVDELASARATYPRTVRVLLASGAGSDAVARILAETNDRMTGRVLELAHRELGPAPAPYAWLCMGTEGRRAQTLRTDQDNGLVWSDDAPAGADTYFAQLAEWSVAALERTGAPRCPGNVMATNPIWRGPLDAWRQRFTAWLGEPRPEALLSALIAFDFRAAAGDARLAEELRGWLVPHVASAHRLLAHVAAGAAGHRPSIGPFGGIILERSGPDKGSFDVKRTLAPMVDGARLLALEGQVSSTNTLERLAAAHDRGALPDEDLAELRAAYLALQLLRLRSQLAAIDAGEAPHNRIHPRRLVHAERASLREHLAAIERFRRGIELDRAMAVRSV